MDFREINTFTREETLATFASSGPWEHFFFSDRVDPFQKGLDAYDTKRKSQKNPLFGKFT